MLISDYAIPASAVDVRHYLTDSGMYAREMIMPKGMTVTGKAKKVSYITVLTAGFVTEVTPTSKTNYRAPCVIVSEPNIKRAIHAHELSVLMTVHHTDKYSLADIEDDILVPLSDRQLDLEELWRS